MQSVTPRPSEIAVKPGNTLFPKPGPGQAVWADVNGNGIYDPGGKNGDKAISHVKICADLLSEQSPRPTPTEPGTDPAPTPAPTQPGVTPAPTPVPPGGEVSGPTIDLSSPTECVPTADFGVAMQLTNGLNTTCLRVSASYFSLLAFSPREQDVDEGTFVTQDLDGEGKTLANTGADTNTLLLWALMLFGAGMVFTFVARRRV